ncbi:MAG: hypothetical protein J0L93_03995 [Deltaproteobacteria bacterium]|nr:hypothetical protein [Deltaproteobacteria bacterium]
MKFLKLVLKLNVSVFAVILFLNVGAKLNAATYEIVSPSSWLTNLDAVDAKLYLNNVLTDGSVLGTIYAKFNGQNEKTFKMARIFSDGRMLWIKNAATSGEIAGYTTVKILDASADGSIVAGQVCKSYLCRAAYWTLQPSGEYSSVPAVLGSYSGEIVKVVNENTFLVNQYAYNRLPARAMIYESGVARSFEPLSNQKCKYSKILDVAPSGEWILGVSQNCLNSGTSSDWNQTEPSSFPTLWNRQTGASSELSSLQNFMQMNATALSSDGVIVGSSIVFKDMVNYDKRNPAVVWGNGGSVSELPVPTNTTYASTRGFLNGSLEIFGTIYSPPQGSLVYVTWKRTSIVTNDWVMEELRPSVVGMPANTNFGWDPIIAKDGSIITYLDPTDLSLRTSSVFLRKISN